MRESDEFGVFVMTRDGETITSLIRRFKRKVSKAGVLKEFREHTEFLKPSVKKKRKQKEARSREEKEKLKSEKDIMKLNLRKKTKVMKPKEAISENVTCD